MVFVFFKHIIGTLYKLNIKVQVLEGVVRDVKFMAHIQYAYKIYTIDPTNRETVSTTSNKSKYIRYIIPY